jgi:exodeoxyribonuclease V alpha subunit
MERSDAAEGAALIQELVARRLPSKFGFDPSEDIQVLTPMHKGACGTESLNALLQETLRDGARTATRNDRIFREGDRVIATRNDYERIPRTEKQGASSVIDTTGEVTGEFGTSVHRFKPNEWDDLQLSYTLTVHQLRKAANIRRSSFRFSTNIGRCFDARFSTRR